MEALQQGIRFQFQIFTGGSRYTGCQVARGSCLDLLPVGYVIFQKKKCFFLNFMVQFHGH